MKPEFRSWYKRAQEIPSGLVEEGLHLEYPDIAEKIQKYVYDNDPSGIHEALSNENYSAYYADLQRLLRSVFGSVIKVRRKQGYAGGSGTGVGDFVSVSTNPNWQGTDYLVRCQDVVLAGYEAEGELIVRKSGLVPA